MKDKIKADVHLAHPLSDLFYNSHFINQVAAVAELVDDEENVADIYGDTTLEVVVEIDVTAQ